MAQGAEPAQHHGNDRPRQPAVAIVERRKRRGRGARIGAFEHLVERPVPIAARPRRYRPRPAAPPGRARRRARRSEAFFLRAFFAKNSSLQEGHGYAKSEAMPTEPQNPARTRGPSERKAPAAAGRRTRACRSGSAPRRTRPQRRSGQGIRRPRRPRSDPLWRLGKGRLDLGFLAGTTATTNPCAAPADFTYFIGISRPSGGLRQAVFSCSPAHGCPMMAWAKLGGFIVLRYFALGACAFLAASPCATITKGTDPSHRRRYARRSERDVHDHDPERSAGRHHARAQ